MVYQKLISEYFSFKTTSISCSERYINKNINSSNEVIKLIKEDSIKKERKCNPFVLKVDKKIKEETDIYGVNLCEIDLKLALNIYNTLKEIYTEYKGIKGYVTDLSLTNDTNTSHITSFKPNYIFVTSSNSNAFPMAIKSQVLLNSRYYLNENYANTVIKQEVNSKNFVSNTSLSSLLVHEYAHVITYVLALKYYGSVNPIFLTSEDYKNYIIALNNYKNDSFSKMIFNEAYKNYKGKKSKDEFRKSISLYANKKDALENVLYNETIAEAFHDYFLNGKEASKESIEVVKVLDKYSIKYALK